MIELVLLQYKIVLISLVTFLTSFFVIPLGFKQIQFDNRLILGFFSSIMYLCGTAVLLNGEYVDVVGFYFVVFILSLAVTFVSFLLSLIVTFVLGKADVSIWVSLILSGLFGLFCGVKSLFLLVFLFVLSVMVFVVKRFVQTYFLVS